MMADEAKISEALDAAIDQVMEQLSERIFTPELIAAARGGDDAEVARLVDQIASASEFTPPKFQWVSVDKMSSPYLEQVDANGSGKFRHRHRQADESSRWLDGRAPAPH